MKTWAVIAQSLMAGEPRALVSVAATQGSAPREPGAHMIVTSRGCHGSIGGGALEWRAIAQAQALIRQGGGNKQSTHALGPELGQCCGGRVVLATETFSQSDLEEVRSLAGREAHGPFALQRNGVQLSFGTSYRTLYLFGAGHVGRAMVLALAPLPFAVNWIDPRPDAFPAAVPENVRLIAPADVPGELAGAAAGSLAFIMSHSHALDLAIVDAALRNANIAWVGLIGSTTKRARFEKRLAAAGVSAQCLDRLICPIGLAGISSKHPAMIAAASVAQILVLDDQLGLATQANQPQASIQTSGKGQ